MISLLPLAILTLRQPGAAARSLLLSPLSREAIWTALCLIVVLNALSYTVMNLLFPLSEELSFLKLSTGSYIIISTALTVLFALLLSVGGRWLGGQGRFLPVLTLLIWIQVVQLFLQVLVIVFTFALPLLGSLLGLVGNLFLVFVLLHFINEAHGFASLWRSAAVVVMAAILLFFAMMFFAGLIGPANIGLPGHV
ncbi:hypothetical protein RSK20926_19127 [Roseobacter sp. SK209-2-6]|uniref:YIP1 family protein n=1 Tax=Roseobacter sp. SK209-2-6 TaxID=388739 RepID=UPI0000F3F606|nr:YIP1 family protein [Roseobacter sp. SK209-2-6]EBA17882.1 hypothetical protein RSK20926_19127 [Roseobacter sp. SK209-2-6]